MLHGLGGQAVHQISAYYPGIEKRIRRLRGHQLGQSRYLWLSVADLCVLQRGDGGQPSSDIFRDVLPGEIGRCIEIDRYYPCGIDGWIEPAAAHEQAQVPKSSKWK